MTRLVALNSEHHRELRIDTGKIERQGANLRMVPVMPGEFLKLAIDYPIVLTKNAETGQFVCVALFGFADGENLYWQDGRWDSLYTPLNIARQPFFVGSGDDGQPMVCVDAHSPCACSEGAGERLFDEDGKATAYLQKIQGMLAQLLDGEKQSAEFVQQLQQLELIIPMHLEVTFADGKAQRVEGLYTVDEKKLQALAGEPLQQLHVSGDLARIHTMLTSLGHIYALIERRNRREATAAA
ncbi:SapC family protein [Microbulbifer hydrolyticus]|uniref:Peptidase n=1 Tax=Microbulbifer hydrolyticus TaxID=48074 RepID=A0A6P1TFV4_9GAMM|nr:SapC family protein [Microbulbifer hydrolyticus]MBB5211902.1 hypothetical protein [Microbulbifer hydrolyticus]QHQ40515.1 peptidase [Microbulbifer hydrolyticus]